MGQLAVYIALDETKLEELWRLDDQSFRKRFLEIEEENYERLDIDKIWDALHCTLTGVSASTPIEDNKFSEAIVGVHPKIYDDEDYSIFVSVIDNLEIEGLLKALNSVNLDTLKNRFNPNTLKEQNIYPKGIWEDEESVLLKEMNSTVISIRKFFERSLKNKMHIIATIL